MRQLPQTLQTFLYPIRRFPKLIQNHPNFHTRVMAHTDPLTRRIKRLLVDQKSTSQTELAFGEPENPTGPAHQSFLNVQSHQPSAGSDLAINYSSQATPWGIMLIASTPRGICQAAFVDPDNPQEAISSLQSTWPEAQLIENEHDSHLQTARLMREASETPARSLTLHLSGTDFQQSVWQYLLTIPIGSVSTYAGIAEHLGDPKAARAVGTAVGQNPLAWLIPCHRVVRSDAHLGGYRWGLERKRQLLEQELIKYSI
jgi:AraC family transcriptional regulator of adaptative response/methylated-DNA-[protein]-cysteine methyltransferase